MEYTFETTIHVYIELNDTEFKLLIDAAVSGTDGILCDANLICAKRSRERHGHKEVKFDTHEIGRAISSLTSYNDKIAHKLCNSLIEIALMMREKNKEINKEFHLSEI